MITPRMHGWRWYSMWQGANNQPSRLRRLRATGELRADRLVMKSVIANRVTAQVRASSGWLEISGVDANVFGGRHRGDWVADFTGAQPKFSGSGRVERLSLAQVSAAMEDPWAS